MCRVFLTWFEQFHFYGFCIFLYCVSVFVYAASSLSFLRIFDVVM